MSKRCCPVCAHLLKLLKTHSGENFVITGEHSTITPCTLPEWLPEPIINQMVKAFALRLRKELVELQKRPEVLRGRAHLNDTRRISLDSLGAPEDAVPSQLTDDAFHTFHSNKLIL